MTVATHPSIIDDDNFAAEIGGHLSSLTVSLAREGINQSDSYAPLLPVLSLWMGECAAHEGTRMHWNLFSVVVLEIHLFRSRLMYLVLQQSWGKQLPVPQVYCFLWVLTEAVE